MPVQLAYLDHAAQGPEAGPPLIVAHGLFGSARNFNTLGRRWAADRRVILVDMRNHGASPWADDMDYPAQAGDLADAVERLAGGHAVILGHSMGGKAAMALALTRPELVAGLIVADIAPIAYTHTHLPYVQGMRAVDLGRVRRRSDADPMLADAVPEPSLRAFLLQNLLVEDGTARWRLNLEAIEREMPRLTGWPADWPQSRYRRPDADAAWRRVGLCAGSEQEADRRAVPRRQDRGDRGCRALAARREAGRVRRRRRALARAAVAGRSALVVVAVNGRRSRADRHCLDDAGRRVPSRTADRP